MKSTMVPAARLSMAPAVFQIVFVLLPMCFAWLAASKPSGAAWGINALFLVVSLALSTALHEVGHAAVATWVGLRAFRAYLGRGPAIWERSFGTLSVVVQALPFTGLVLLASPSRVWLRARLAAVYAAGPLMNALLCFAALSLMDLNEAAFTRLAKEPVPLYAFALVNGLMAVTNAIPAKARKRGQHLEVASDGWNFLAVPFRSDAKLTPILTTFAALEAVRLVQAAQPKEALAYLEQQAAAGVDSFALRVSRSDALIATARWGEAREVLREATRAPEASIDVRPLLLNNLAWVSFMLADPALLEEADECSREAFERNRKHPSFNGTRGAVLAARGDVEGAEPLLKYAFEHNEVAAHRALNACGLAMIQAHRGDAEGARRWIETARSLSPHCSLLRRAEDALAAP